MSKIKILADEPDLTSDLFSFNRYANDLFNFITDSSIPTPFTIGINGEWGSGKTSLLKRVYEILKNSNSFDCKIIWFNAWEYERIDPASSLMHRIALEFPYKNKKYKQKLKTFTPALKFVNNIPTLLSLLSGHPPLPSLNFEFDKIVENIHSIDKPIPAITEELQRMIGDSRLIVFVDDLDRCRIDSSMEILESIKLFLQAKNITFVIAVDMEMIERACELRYGTSSEKDFKAKDHINKIFQLQLTLPFKHQYDVEKFIKKHAPYLCPDESTILLSSLKQNPRKIKNILNTLNFIVRGIRDGDGELFNDLFPAAFIWSIISSSYTELIHILGTSIDSDIIKLALISYFLTDHHNLQMEIDEFDNISNENNINFKNGYYIPGKVIYSPKRNDDLKDIVIGYRIIAGLRYLEKDPSAFYFFSVLGMVILLNPHKLRKSGEPWDKYGWVECPKGIDDVKDLQNKDLTRLLSAHYRLSEFIIKIILFAY